MTKLVGDVNGSAQHQGAEGNALPPAPEAEHQDNGEDEEDDAADVLLPVQHVDGNDEAPDDVEDAGDPDDLLGKGADAEDIAHAEDDRNE